MTEPTAPFDIFLFVPNIIGFTRVILALLSFYFMPLNVWLAGLTYLGSQLLDAVDGYAARYMNQCTQFGAILDQLTDRCTFLGLLMTLCHFYPNAAFWLQVVGVVDVACHWIHLHSSLLQGRTSHKLENINPVLRVYYSNKWVLFILCACNELCFISLYCLHFATNGKASSLFYGFTVATAPFACAKLGVSLVQGFVAGGNIALIDARERDKRD